jgi:serine/threonine-protein kinase
MVSMKRLFHNRYRIEKLIGSGAMGRVYSAHDTKAGADVALRIFPPEWCTGQAAAARLAKQAQASYAVRHPNVVSVFDFGIEEGAVFLTMELVGGQSLKAELARGSENSERAVLLIRQIAAGLGALHKAGLSHGNLRPSNVLIDAKGVAKISDFSTLSGIGLYAAQAPYAAPECWHNSDTSAAATPAADIYALGAVSYRLLTGVLPFDANSPEEWMHKHTADALVAPSFIVPELTHYFDPFVRELMAKDPAARPHDAAWVNDFLKKWDAEGRRGSWSTSDTLVVEPHLITGKVRGHATSAAVTAPRTSLERIIFGAFCLTCALAVLIESPIAMLLGRFQGFFAGKSIVLAYGYTGLHLFVFAAWLCLPIFFVLAMTRRRLRDAMNTWLSLALLAMLIAVIASKTDLTGLHLMEAPLHDGFVHGCAASLKAAYKVASHTGFEVCHMFGVCGGSR